MSITSSGGSFIDGVRCFPCISVIFSRACVMCPTRNYLIAGVVGGKWVGVRHSSAIYGRPAKVLCPRYAEPNGSVPGFSRVPGRPSGQGIIGRGFRSWCHRESGQCANTSKQLITRFLAAKRKMILPRDSGTNVVFSQWRNLQNSFTGSLTSLY